MSLKDRLQTANTAVQKKAFEEIKPVLQMPNESPVVSNGQITLGVLDEILLDEEINSIFVSGSKNIYIEKKGSTHKSLKTFRDNVQLINILKKNAKENGIELTETNPYVKYNHKKGVNLTVTIPPLSNPISVFIKCYYDKFATLNRLMEFGALSKELALILEALATLKNNILIVGEQGSLKTTFLSALAKALLPKNRGVLVDYNQEITIEEENYSNFDFSNLKNFDKTCEFNILNSIIAMNPDRLAVNANNEDVLNYLINKVQDGFRGLIITVTAVGVIEAMDKITYMLQKNNPNLTYEEAKDIAYSSFDAVIFLKNEAVETGEKTKAKRLVSLSQIKNNKLEDIINLNSNFEYQSLGVIPEFYSQLKNTSLNSNIFEVNYKHTLHKKFNFEEKETAAVNPDILKKFKPQIKEETFEEKPVLSKDELMKKAQEKFSELKRNAKLQENSLNKEDENN